jgi:hypothetical protein
MHASMRPVAPEGSPEIGRYLEGLRARVPEGYEWVLLIDEAHFETFWGFDGSPRGPSWLPIQAEILHAEEGQVLQPSDLP